MLGLPVMLPEHTPLAQQRCRATPAFVSKKLGRGWGELVIEQMLRASTLQMPTNSSCDHKKQLNALIMLPYCVPVRLSRTSSVSM